MGISASEKLRRFYAQFSSTDHVLILINADPDAIASAMAVRRLLWRKVSYITISCVNVVKRPDNLAMIRLLGVKIIHADELSHERRFHRIVLADSQPDHHKIFEKFAPDIVIDHHPDTGCKASFTDIRPNYGATATIMTEYLRAANIKPSVRLATGLFHAIKTDTSNFERKTLSEDLKAFQFLFRYANISLARKIEHADIRLDFLKYFKIALQNMRMNKSRVFVHLGCVVNPDICVLIADFFMRVNPVTWSIVSGIYEDKLIIIFRNDGIRKDAGTLAKRSFGELGSAGGHQSMARAEIPVSALGNLSICNDDKKIMQWMIARIEQKNKVER
jgi:nanoRNase/pAp phosphatase (c-di-AMP/oligoRNAs hydrolase)